MCGILLQIGLKILVQVSRNTLWIASVGFNFQYLAPSGSTFHSLNQLYLLESHMGFLPCIRSIAPFKWKVITMLGSFLEQLLVFPSLSFE